MYHVRLIKWATESPDPRDHPISEDYDAAFMLWRDARPRRPEPLVSRAADWSMMAAAFVLGWMLAILGRALDRGRAA